MFVVIIGWVVAFPFALYIGVLMLRSKSQTPNQFLIGLLFPPSTILFLVRSCLISKDANQQYNDVNVNLDDDFIHTIKLSNGSNFDSVVFERSALLATLNGPFKTNLQHLHDEDIDTEEEEMEGLPWKLVWEPVLVLRRLVLLLASIFNVDPILKLYPIGVLLLLFGFHDFMVQPFADYLLNKFQMIAYGLLFALTLINSF